MSDNGLTSGDFTAEDEPFALFAQWLKDAEASEVNDPNALALATVDDDGLPNVRMVLLKGYDAQGFVFYTNFESRKGREILGQKKAAMCFHWKSLRRQVRIRGPVEIVTNEEADAYYASRPGAAAASAPGPRNSPARWKAVSRWKRPWRSTRRKFAIGEIPRPEYWSGFPYSPGVDRVLARPALPPARSCSLRARNAGCRLVEGSPLSVSEQKTCRSHPKIGRPSRPAAAMRPRQIRRKVSSLARPNRCDPA